jgi:RNA polymerase sigma-54 factor
MLLQVAPHDPDYPDIAAILTDHLEALARNKLPEVAAALGRSVVELQDLLARIRKLDPRPGAGFEACSGRESIHPDVVVRLVGERIEVEIDDMVLPDLGIRTDYEHMAADRQVDRETRSYLRGKLRSARELIHAVEQRKRTLGRVTHAIMWHQLEFLAQGPSAVRSLCMRQISEQVGLHPSTVSRAIAGKYAQTDHGIFRLRDFFDGDRRVSTPGGGGKGRLAVNDLVRDLIAAEDPAAPLSDDELVAALLTRNVKVARRTVAKYRKELGLPSSWRRKRHESQADDGWGPPARGVRKGSS